MVSAYLSFPEVKKHNFKKKTTLVLYDWDTLEKYDVWIKMR